MDTVAFIITCAIIYKLDTTNWTWFGWLTALVLIHIIICSVFKKICA